MPQKRASSSKRKAASPVTDEGEPMTKMPRVEEETTNTQPTNKVLPVTIEFRPRVDDCLRLATWNIAGWSASHKKVQKMNHLTYGLL
jgi:AP endonuclease 1